MKLTEKKKQALYNAVSNRVMDARVKIVMRFRDGTVTQTFVDELLAEAAHAAANDALLALEGKN